MAKQLIGLHIEGRRWFRKSAGNTYSSFRIYAGGELVHASGRFGGYGDHYLTEAVDWLSKQGLIDGPVEYGTRYVREELKGTYSVVDVGREKDL